VKYNRDETSNVTEVETINEVRRREGKKTGPQAMKLTRTSPWSQKVGNKENRRSPENSKGKMVEVGKFAACEREATRGAGGGTDRRSELRRGFFCERVNMFARKAARGWVGREKKE